MSDVPVAPLSKSTIDAVLHERVKDLCSVEVLQETESTNTLLIMDKDGVGTSFGSLAVCAAEHQTKGRGRRGKTWHTPDGGVTFSLRYTVPCGLAGVSGLSLLAGAAVCDFLRAYSAEAVRVKWPNDILVGGSKLVGILVEVADHTASSTTVVVGIGVNYRRGPEAQMIDQQSTDLVTLCEGSPPDRSALIAGLAAQVYNASCCDVATAVRQLSARWSQYDAFGQQELEVHSAAETVIGISGGIDDSGQLKIVTDGGVRVFSSADVSVRKVQRLS